MNNGYLKNARLAILGSTGYIGRSLLGSARLRGLSVVALSRDVLKAKKTFASYGIEVEAVDDYSDFLRQDFDVLINASGIGSQRKLKDDPTAVFSAVKEVDDLIFKYLEEHPKTWVFNMSSGAIYGRSINEAVDQETLAVFNPAAVLPGDAYSLAKLSSEVRHRLSPQYAIIDLRVFAFVSQWLDIEETFFLSEVARSLVKEETLSTLSNDMVRDYCTADDLWEVIEFLLDQPPMNDVFDMMSRLPVTKFEILKRLFERFGLQYQVSDEILVKSPTGQKNSYFSKSSKLSVLGFVPNRTALENIELELGKLLDRQKKI